MTAHLTPSSSRNLALDGLRGIAALGVAITHAYPTYTFWIGWSFVDLFFVLSGFLIGSMLLDERVNLGNFLIRRALRIWPLYYITLALALAASYLRAVGNSGIGTPDDVVPSLFFLQFTDLYGSTNAVATEQVQGYILWFGHSWTLAIEQQFYVLLPLFLALFKPSRRTIVVIAGAVLTGTVIYRGSGQCLGLLASRADGLILGVVLAALVGVGTGAAPRLRRPPRWLWLIVAGLGITLVAPYVADGYLANISHGTWPHNPLTVLGFALFYSAVVGWVVFDPEGTLSRWLSNSFLVYLGVISYAVYMLHPLIQGVVGMYERGLPLAQLPLVVQLAMWLMTIGCAHLSKVWVEDRFNALKSRFPLYRDVEPASPTRANALPQLAKEVVQA